MEKIKLKYNTDETRVILPKSILQSGWWLIDNDFHQHSQTGFSFKDRSINLPNSKGTI